jgi:asparagine synthase (glutamine-hydrolysing)
LRADVPLAIALSGGLDSSVVAVEMVRHGAAPEAFTAVFDGDETDLPYARRMAAHLDLSHHVVRAGGADLASQFDRTVAEFDEPFADSSGVATLALARAVGRSHKAILTGDGGDEAFGGYPHYEFVAAKQKIKACAAAVGFADGCGRTGVYVQSKSTFRRAERNRLMERSVERQPVDALGSLLAADDFHQVAPGEALKHALWSDRHLYLANDLTYKTDLALASQGVEGRAPLLDHRLLEWTQNLPAVGLVRGRQKKVLLREAYQGELPREVAARPKHGFGAPVARWLDGPLKDIAHDLVPCRLLDREAQRGARGQRLWTLVALAQWAREWRATW